MLFRQTRTQGVRCYLPRIVLDVHVRASRNEGRPNLSNIK